LGLPNDDLQYYLFQRGLSINTCEWGYCSLYDSNEESAWQFY